MAQLTSADIVQHLRDDIGKLEDAFLAAMPEAQRQHAAAAMAGSMFGVLAYIRHYFEDMAHFRQVLLAEQASHEGAKGAEHE